MAKTTSAERMKKLRAKRKLNQGFDEDCHMKEKERCRIGVLRERQKEEREKDIVLKELYREKERLRKKEQRKRKREEDSGSSCKNVKNGKVRRKNNIKAAKEEVKNLQLKVKLFQNKNRRLKRQLNSTLDSEDSDSDTYVNSSRAFLDAISPSSKRRAKQRLKLSDPPSPVRKALRLDRLVDQISDKNNKTCDEVIRFMTSDLNSVVVPNEKKSKKELRYRLASLETLYEKFLAESDIDISYSQFTRYVPINIVKPKPQDWGTCLCQTCLNPEFKIECIRKTLGVEIDMEKLTMEKVGEVCDDIVKSGKTFEYLEWVKGKEKGKINKENVKNSTYHSKKVVGSSDAKEFAGKVKDELLKFIEHVERMKSQYRRIREIKDIVKNDENKAKMLRIDWSENAELYQTIQEKSQYYTSVSASVNTAVLYEAEGTTSLATLSDVKSHKAGATWASLASMFKGDVFEGCKTLYIISDSPTSQYRNRKTVFLGKKWAVETGISLYWVFTETGHGKGPMDGVGAGMKSVIKDTIAFHPRGVITNCEQLMEYLPSTSIKVSTYQDSDYKAYQSMYPKPLRNLQLVARGFGISHVHEVFISSSDDSKVEWKKLSSDEHYTQVKINISKLVKPRKEKSALPNEAPKEVELQEETSEEELEGDDDQECIDTIKNAWISLSVPVPEKEIVGKWYGVIWTDKKASNLYVAKVLRRFLNDEDGPVKEMEMRCLKLKVGVDTILEDTASHRPDIQMFGLCDIIAGPLDVKPLKSRLFDVPQYLWLKEHFMAALNIDRNILFKHHES